ncbi:MAG: hypothetical protein KDD50_13860 [Bdellovibrionales bacterium]|nr:hypothetical protein [Bdellovibrionales bacterium]
MKIDQSVKSGPAEFCWSDIERLNQWFAKTREESGSKLELQGSLKRGLQKGQIVEWGMPHGQNTRSVLLSFIRACPDFVLWVYGDSSLEVYPPAWAAQGIDLSKIYFTCCERPIQTLKPIFLESGFSLIVLDSPKKLTQGELAFACSSIRKNKQSLFIVRDFFLNPNKGNPLARFRVNGFMMKTPPKRGVSVLQLKAVRGNSQPLFLKEEEFR